jgi:hypothetical protein
MRTVVAPGTALIGSVLSTLAACGGSSSVTDAGADAAFDVNPDFATGILPLEACGTFTPCGGEAKGKWNIAATCTSVGSQGSGLSICPQARFDLTKVKIEGSLDLRADSTYTSSTTTSGTPGVTLPQTCLKQFMFGGQPVTCVQGGAALTLLVSQDAMSPISKVDCNEVGQDCNCVIVFKTNPPPVVETGTWRTENNTLFRKPKDATRESGAEYCVDNNLLRLKTTISTGFGSLMGSSSGPEALLVFQR